jgi:hypothetical protein
MKKNVTLTESDLVRIINRVINEGLTSTAPLKDFPDGIYKLTEVQAGTEVKGPFLKQEKGVTRIYSNTHKLQKDGSLYGGGKSYSTGGADSTYDN